MTTSRQRRSTTRRMWAGAAALMCVGFLALAFWQLQRLQWKHALIARVDARVHAAPADLPEPSRWPYLTKQADEYRHLRAAGVWLDGMNTRVQAATELGSGFWLLVPLCLNDGSVVLVNRGFVPAQAADFKVVAPQRAGAAACLADPTRASTVRVTGLLRLSETGGGFLRRNEPNANRWFSRDVGAISALHALTRSAPYFIDADAASAPAVDGEPVGGLTVVSFQDNHLVYALTWCALALMAAAACRLILRERENSN